jgi:hypothetical protein
LAGAGPAAAATSGDFERLREELQRSSAAHGKALEQLHAQLGTAGQERAKAETARDFLQARVEALGVLNDAANKASAASQPASPRANERT